CAAAMYTRWGKSRRGTGHVMALIAGMKLRSYEILERLGSGGMGEVYLAHDTHLNRNVAVKLLPEEYSADMVARERLWREAISAAALDHPFICKIFEVGENGGAIFIVMEYVRGHTLLHQMRSDGLAHSDVLRIAGE